MDKFRKRKGNKLSRKNRETRDLKPGNYVIVTDGTKTEVNYLNALFNSLNSKNKSVKIITSRSHELVKEALNVLKTSPNYCRPWIVFDRDQVVNFDQIIESAHKTGIGVAWSNPCIETWFSAYFGKLLTYPDSTNSVKHFAQLYKRKTKNKYHKNDVNIYKILLKYGNEEQALKSSQLRYEQHQKNGYIKPSEMVPASTIHNLIKEIKY